MLAQTASNASFQTVLKCKDLEASTDRQDLLQTLEEERQFMASSAIYYENSLFGYKTCSITWNEITFATV